MLCFSLSDKHEIWGQKMEGHGFKEMNLSVKNTRGGVVIVSVNCHLDRI